MKSIVTDQYTFEPSNLNKIEEGYQVWNIHSIGEGCVPLFQSLGKFTVNPNTLKYIKVSKEEAKYLHTAASYGIRSLKDCERLLNNKRTTRQKKNLASLVLPIYKEYTI